MFKKELKLTAKCRQIFNKYAALEKMGNKYIEENNDARARQAYIDAEDERVKFWDCVASIYPQVRKHRYSYSVYTNTIIRKEE